MSPARSSSSPRGHTTRATQLELDWATIPPATSATSDFVCWLCAAFPQRDGQINITRVASALGISRTTVRRWITSNRPRLTHAQQIMLSRRAILRGRGHYLWPALDPVSRRRSELNLNYALQCVELIRSNPAAVPPEWHNNGTMEPRTVHLLYFPRAHVYGVASISADKSLRKLLRFGEILETTRAPNKYAGIALKLLTLQRVDEARCIAPRELIPTGRTETWLESAGAPKLRKRLPK